MTSPQAPCGGSCGRPRGLPTIWSKASLGPCECVGLSMPTTRTKLRKNSPRLAKRVSSSASRHLRRVPSAVGSPIHHHTRRSRRYTMSSFSVSGNRFLMEWCRNGGRAPARRSRIKARAFIMDQICQVRLCHLPRNRDSRRLEITSNRRSALRSCASSRSWPARSHEQN